MRTSPAPSADKETCERKIYILYLRLRLRRKDPEHFKQLPELEDQINLLLEEHFERWSGEHVATR